MSHEEDKLAERLTGLRGRLSENQRVEILSALGLVDHYVTIQTPIGAATVAFNDRGISFLRRATSPERFAADYARQVGRRPLTPGGRPPAGVLTALRTGRTGNIRVDLRSLTPFQRDVLTVTREVPVGEVRPYSWIAARIGRPRAVRAVGTALGHNPVPLVIPCHRVIRSDGQPGDYIFGPDTKQTILHAEGVDLDHLAELHRRGFSFVASESTGVFCHPSCHNARRISDQHRVLLTDAAQAAERHFRPCRVCRPAPVAD